MKFIYPYLKNFLIIAAVFGILTSFFVQPLPVFAQLLQDIQSQLDPIGNVYGNPEPGDPRPMVMRLIFLFLNLLGIIFIILIIYGGFLWMTSGGNDEQVERAKKTIIRATIGLAVIFVSYIITLFVFDVLIQGTGISTK